jgi:hypothetical protein
MKHYVYEYVDPRNGQVFYVGMGEANRSKVHLRPSMLKDGSPKSKRITEILDSGHLPTIRNVCTGLTRAQACEFEKAVIMFYGKENLTNRTTGGQGHAGSKSMQGRKMPETAKEKIRLSKLGSRNPMYGKKRTPEALQKFKDATSGINHHTYGQPRSEDTRAKISQSLKGRSLTDEQKRQRSAQMTEVWRKRKEGLL